mgnify:CR=1 FL=1
MLTIAAPGATGALLGGYRFAGYKTRPQPTRREPVAEVLIAVPEAGAVLRIPPDLKGSQVVACGFRAANGVGVGPGGELTVCDNQGNWTPSSRINVVRPGGFYGWMPHVLAAGGSPRTDYDPPLCWIPVSVDNSGGSQAWAPPGDARWGPLVKKIGFTAES